MTFEAHVTDDIAGLSEVRFQAVHPEIETTKYCSTATPVSGNSTDGVFQCNMVFPLNSPPGEWKVGIQRLVDAVGNVNFLAFVDLADFGFPTMLLNQPSDPGPPDDPGPPPGKGLPPGKGPPDGPGPPPGTGPPDNPGPPV